MNPDFRAELPPLAVPEAQAPVNGAQTSPEVGVAAPTETTANPSHTMPAKVSPTSGGADDQTQQKVQDNGSTNTGPTMPTIADDTDLIEKEWVDKAKQIVEQTKNDPYVQNQEMNKLKTDYIKKRYNKDMSQA